MKAVLTNSKAKGKRFAVVVENRTINFGSSEMDSFPIHKDPERKKRYLIRHRAREDWTDPKTAGFWSRWLLWGEPTIKDSIKQISKKYGIDVIDSRKDKSIK